MLYTGRILAVSQVPTPFYSQCSRCCYLHGKLKSKLKWRSRASDPDVPLFGIDSSAEKDSSAFCIIEGPETVQDFAAMELQEIQGNIRSRRNKILLLIEENPSNLKAYYATCFTLISGVMLFGGLLAPTLEIKLGLGGTSYADFIRSIHLPMQLSQVDPIVASFSGGAVGVISALMVVEINNVKQHEDNQCKYCLGTGYLACALCASTGSVDQIDPVSKLNEGVRPLWPPKSERCSNCSGSGKVMCPTCLCTGMAMASEHDPGIDPFD